MYMGKDVYGFNIYKKIPHIMIKRFESFEHRQLEEYSMSEKVAKFLIQKINKSPLVANGQEWVNDVEEVEEAKIVYLHKISTTCHSINQNSNGIEDIPVISFNLLLPVNLGNIHLDTVIYDVILWTEQDNMVASIIIRRDVDDPLNKVFLYVEKIHREPLEEFLKRLNIH